MKKFLALVLAIIMAFSVVTVAFATDSETPAAPDAETTTAPSDEATDEAGSLDWLLDLPVWTLKPGSKIIKIALKLVKVFVKIAMAFGIIDTGDIIDQIMGIINGNGSDDTTGSDETTTAPIDVTEAPAAA